VASGTVGEESGEARRKRPPSSHLSSQKDVARPSTTATLVMER
jgi:hypothetical protein